MRAGTRSRFAGRWVEQAERLWSGPSVAAGPLDKWLFWWYYLGENSVDLVLVRGQNGGRETTAWVGGRGIGGVGRDSDAHRALLNGTIANA